MPNGRVEGPDHQPAALSGRDRRARDSASAMEDYRAARRAVDENTARLRALRLARDAARDDNAKPATKTRKRVGRIAK